MAPLLRRAAIINTKKLKPDLFASYDIRPRNGEEHSYFGTSQICHLLDTGTYLLIHLPTYFQPRDPHGASKTEFTKYYSKQQLSGAQVFASKKQRINKWRF